MVGEKPKRHTNVWSENIIPGTGNRGYAATERIVLFAGAEDLYWRQWET